VHGLPIELLLRFDRRKAHVLIGHGFVDRFRIDEVVLVRLAADAGSFCSFRHEDMKNRVPIKSRGPIKFSRASRATT
jgi:hypothetical protein